MKSDEPGTWDQEPLVSTSCSLALTPQSVRRILSYGINLEGFGQERTCPAFHPV